MYYVDTSRATLDGVDLGRPIRLHDNPRIGDVALPARGILPIGQGAGQILEPAEYERNRAAVLTRVRATRRPPGSHPGRPAR